MRTSIVFTLALAAPAVLAAPLRTYSYPESDRLPSKPVDTAPEDASLIHQARANVDWTKAIGTAGGVMQAINAAVNFGSTIKGMIKSRSELQELAEALR